MSVTRVYRGERGKKSVDVHRAFLEARQGVELLEEQEAKDGHEQPVLCQGEAWMDGAQLASRQQALLRGWLGALEDILISEPK